MALDLIKDTGTPIEKQRFTWRELAPRPISKLDDDALTRVRVILLNGVEHESVLFKHMAKRFTDGALRLPMALVERADHYQQTTVNWLLGADHSPLETTVAYEQVAIVVTASVAQQEPDPYLAQAYRFALLEDFDHLYRYSALMDRMEGKDPNNILQSYTDIAPGRPTEVHHRHPSDDLRQHYDRTKASLASKLHATLITAGELQTHDYYMNIGPMFADPVARQLYAEIAQVEQAHITHYGSLVDPGETILEQWLMHEAEEAWAYYSCMESETNPRIRAIWERFVDYELGQLNMVRELMKKHEGRDPAQLLAGKVETIRFESHRDFVRKVLADETDLRTNGTQFVPKEQEGRASQEERARLNSEGVPSNIVAAGYQWHPGGELARNVVNL